MDTLILVLHYAASEIVRYVVNKEVEQVLAAAAEEGQDGLAFASVVEMLPQVVLACGH